jgi:hypothetical protein
MSSTWQMAIEMMSGSRLSNGRQSFFQAPHLIGRNQVLEKSSSINVWNKLGSDVELDQLPSC